jgi:hypothetical protein
MWPRRSRLCSLSLAVRVYSAHLSYVCSILSYVMNVAAACGFFNIWRHDDAISAFVCREVRHYDAVAATRVVDAKKNKSDQASLVRSRARIRAARRFSFNLGAAAATRVVVLTFRRSPLLAVVGV